ncbi:DUF2625 family protein [Streptomyces sp. NPDC091416]|uniref:DUF2625 family protein n=1 Tax=Streptomyces sp. NPDC091416 TaxID=3366003 RepID=UPI0037F9D611
MRQLSELTDVDEPAWPILQAEFAGSPVAVEMLPGDPGQGRASLLQLQVGAGSALGAMALHSGGLIVDHGWLRVLGGAASDGAGLPGLARVNRFPDAFDAAWRPTDALVVGHDVLGGVFALNGHDPAACGRPGAPGQMLYFAPDSLRWEAMEIGYGTWLTWLLSGRLEKFYDGLRWPGWQSESQALDLSRGIAVYPFLWSQEAHADLASTTREPVPMPELLGLSVDFCRQAGLGDPGFLGSLSPEGRA